MADPGFLNSAQGVPAKSLNFVTNISSPPALGPLDKLEARIAAGAIHDSAERCDAPKCHPETRVAVQDDLYTWIAGCNRESELPRKIKWVTGPAGSGKTAIMRSVADRCGAGNILYATFFFASWSASIDRRRKTSLITTIVHQLARDRPDLREAISKAIDENPDIFDKNLHVQMEVLVLAPLREIPARPDGTELRGVIIVDGLDECEAEQSGDSMSPGARGKTARTNAQDQHQILEVLLKASLDPFFPFHILIASRPERVFRDFFDPNKNPISFAEKVDLQENYDADADITLFLGAHFSRILRQHNLPSSWLPAGTVELLVETASGRFIYAATVIRLLDAGDQEPSKALLKTILKLKATSTSHPLEQLDALYSHILRSSPDPRLSILWIRSINQMNNSTKHSTTTNVNLVLQADPDSSEAEHVLGSLRSLIRIPLAGEQDATEYSFYHKTLFDFLEDPGRCGELYVEWREVNAFIWDGFIRACMKVNDNHPSYSGDFAAFFASLPQAFHPTIGKEHSKVFPTPPNPDRKSILRALGIVANRYA